MGRRSKQGFDYFPWEVGGGGINDRKIDASMDECGSDAYALYHFLLDAIYSDKEYYVVRDKALDFAAARKLRVSKGRIQEVIECLKEYDLIVEIEHDGEIYITSHGIQTTFLRMRSECKRSGDFERIPGVWMLDGEKNISSDLIRKNPIKSDKVNKSKQKESKTNKTTQEEPAEVGPVESDVFVPSYSEKAEKFNRILENEMHMGPKEYTWVRDAVDFYDERAIQEAIDLGLKAKSEGRLKGNLLKYVSAVLQNWNLGNGVPEYVKREEANYEEEKAKRTKPGVVVKELMRSGM